MARGVATGLSGILPVDKPAGMTSHDVVSFVRRASGERRVGHAGTLDPMATGLLVVLVGPATRLARYLSADAKTYEASIAFGCETDTCDAEGRVVLEAPVDRRLFDEQTAREQVAALTGAHVQTPPAYSAVKLGGRKAYEIAREGGQPEIEPREIEVLEAHATGVSEAGGAPVWDVVLTVSKGTYVRSLARDLGRKLGTAAHLAALRRTSSGALGIEDAHTLEQVREAAGGGAIQRLFVEPLAALALPVVAVGPERSKEVASGRPVPCDAACMPGSGEAVAITSEDRLLGVYRRVDRRLVPETVLPGGVG